MGELNLHPPEHPRFPSNADQVQDPHRTPTEHEQKIFDVFLRYKQLPDFENLAAPIPKQLGEALHRIEKVAAQPADPLRDQDERVLDLLSLITDFPEVFGKVGYFLAAEIMNAARNNVQMSEFRRAFFKEYEPMMPGIRDYLRGVANLRRRGRAVKYAATNVPSGQWGSAERRAAAKEQMELVQGLADHYVMEKFWRTLEIVCSYPDFFSREQYDQLVARKGIEQAWRAHLAKAREDLTYFKTIGQTGQLFRQMVDSALEVLRTIIRERSQERPSGESP
ncbi:MAG TPA: hypothetical protein VGR78_04765 [Verrucomicrobiae bacterium]|jgi:hypothetical protein|nr:hypothetical protein [Verrucomicrobiae bacterium]